MPLNEFAGEPQQHERQRPLIDWTDDFEKRLVYHVVAGSVLTDFPDLVDAQLFSGEDPATHTSGGPASIIVQAALDYWKKRRAAPGSNMSDIIAALRRNKDLIPLVQDTWDAIVEHEAAKPTLYEDEKAHIPARCLYRAARQKALAEAEWLAKGEFETIEEWNTAREVLEERVSRIEAAGGAKLLRMVTAADYAAPKVTWLIDGLIPMGMLSMVAGKDGMGKSLLTMEVAKATVTGEPLLGKFQPRTRGRALLLLMDDPDSVIEDRLLVMGLKRDDIDVPQDISTENPMALLRYIYKLAQDQPYAVIVIDCLYVLLPDRANAQNDAGQMRPLLMLLNTIAQKTGAAVILIHHFKKNEAVIAGSFATSAALKVILTVAKPARSGRADQEEEVDESRRVLTLAKSKLVPQNHWDLKLEGPGKWRLLTRDEARALNAQRIVQANPHTGKARAIAFYEEHLGKGQRVPTAKLNADADALGITKKMREDARSVLKVETTSINGISHTCIPSRVETMKTERSKEMLQAFYRKGKVQEGNEERKVQEEQQK